MIRESKEFTLKDKLATKSLEDFAVFD